MTLHNYRITVPKLPLEQSVDLGNTPLNIIHHKCIITLHHSSHFQVRRSYITILHSTWHLHRKQPPMQAQNFQAMGLGWKDLTSTKVVMARLKCPPLCRFQDKGHHLPVRQECLQDWWETIQSIRQRLPALHLHLELHPGFLGDPPLASKQKECSHQQIRTKDMLQELRTYPHCRRFPMTNMMQLIRVIISQTRQVPRENTHSAWSKPNGLWNHLPKR